MAKSSFNNVRIQLKNDTSENWKNSTLVLLAGEFAVENDTGLFKIGNGTDVFSALPYANDAAQVAKEFNELKDKIGTIPDDKTIIQLIKEAATSGGPEYDDSALKKRISDNEAAIAALTGDGDGSVKETVADAIAQVINGAPEDFDTLKEVSDWIKNDKTGAAKMASDIEALNKKSPLIDVLDHRAVRNKVEIGNVPTGTLVNYYQDEVRVMVPSDTEWTANRDNQYYMSVKLFAPSNAKYFRESLDKDITDDTYYEFENYEFSGIDEHGCKYSLVWLPIATLDNDTWTYFGKSSLAGKFIGWYWHANWYDDGKNLIGSDIIRINLSNEDCHSFEEPYYMAKYAQKADLSAAVTKLQAIVAGIGGEGEKATVVAYVTDAINALQIGDYAKAADLTALAGRVDTLEKKPAAGITAKQIEAWDAKQDAGNYVDQSAYNTKIAALEEADTTNSDAITAVKATADKAVPKNAATQAGTGIKVTVDSNGLVTGLAALTKEDIPNIEKDQVNGLVTALGGKQDTLVFETAYDASTNKAATMSDIGDAKNTLVGTAEDKSTVDTIKGAKKYADEKATSALTDAKAYADGLVTGDAGVSARVTALEGKVDVDKVSTAISTAKTEAINDASSKDAAIKSAILGQTDGVDYSGTVKGAYEAAATADGKAVAAQNAVDALSGKVGTIADGKTAAGLISENATAISGINTKIGTVTEGKTIVEMIADAKTAATYDDAEVKASIQSNKSAIDTLNGDSNVDGSVDKKVADAINDFATKVSDDQTVNTFKELIDYAAAHKGEYSTLSGEVQKNTTAIATLNGTGAGSVAKTVEDAVEPVIVRISTLEGKVTDGKIAQWDAAQANVIESIKLNGTAIDIAADKSVNIAIPAATSEALGLAQADGSTIEATDGVLSVKAVGISKVFVEDGVELVMNGGNA